MYLAAVFVVHSVVHTNSNSLERSIPSVASNDVHPHRNEPIPFSFETLINLISYGFRMEFEGFFRALNPSWFTERHIESFSCNQKKTLYTSRVYERQYNNNNNSYNSVFTP